MVWYSSTNTYKKGFEGVRRKTFFSIIVTLLMSINLKPNYVHWHDHATLPSATST